MQCLLMTCNKMPIGILAVWLLFLTITLPFMGQQAILGDLCHSVDN